jgi:Ca2+/H+ antiporter, TMEM165/GDT1 family
VVSFYFAFIAVLLAGLGARDQVLLARLTQGQGQRPMALVVALTACLITAGFAAWAGASIAPLLAPKARVFFAALALAFAGLESLILRPFARLREPTLSLGALAVAMVALQLIDAARFLVFAIAVATDAPLPAGAAGALGGMILVAAAWFAPGQVVRYGVTVARRVIGLLLLFAGIGLGLRALELL